MNFVFQQQFHREMLRSERRRTIILITLFGAAVAFRWINLYVFPDNIVNISVAESSAGWLFPGAIMGFETFSLMYLNSRIRIRQHRLPLIIQYLNAGVEICLPSLLIMTIASRHPGFNVLHSPVMLIYFLFIILSTLRLNFGISLFCGFLAALSYCIFCLFLYGHFDSDNGGWAFLLLLSGVASGLVARQIRSGISHSLREAEKRHRVENLFSQQISPAVAEKMLSGNGVMESRRMEVTVMFIDIRNFTLFARDKSPEEIVQYQNTFFGIIIDIVSRHEGIVNQIMGDGCMATFGAPLAVPDHSRKAVSAAHDILARVNYLVRQGSLQPTRVGIGIHTGDAVTGNIGTSVRQQYSITGNVVIMAARIEQLNKEFHSQLLISEEVCTRLPPANAPGVWHKDVCIKGFERPVNIYQAL